MELQLLLVMQPAVAVNVKIPIWLQAGGQPFVGMYRRRPDDYRPPLIFQASSGFHGSSLHFPELPFPRVQLPAGIPKTCGTIICHAQAHFNLVFQLPLVEFGSRRLNLGISYG